MTVRICDICGASCDDDFLKSYTVIGEIVDGVRGLFKGRPFLFVEKVAGHCDLCVDCQKSLAEWYEERARRDK